MSGTVLCVVKRDRETELNGIDGLFSQTPCGEPCSQIAII